MKLKNYLLICVLSLFILIGIASFKNVSANSFTYYTHPHNVITTKRIKIVTVGGKVKHSLKAGTRLSNVEHSIIYNWIGSFNNRIYVIDENAGYGWFKIINHHNKSRKNKSNIKKYYKKQLNKYIRKFNYENAYNNNLINQIGNKINQYKHSNKSSRKSIKISINKLISKEKHVYKLNNYYGDTANYYLSKVK